MDALVRARAAYAETVRQRAAVRSDALVAAFAKVPRERFLGPGPWRIASSPGCYETTPDADPSHLYRNVLVAIDETRSLNNGEPAGLARWMDALDLTRGARVLHLGAGVGYYSAILAETVGPGGRVSAVELDPSLAARAAENLAPYDHVEVIVGDGSRMDAGPCDAIFVNAGATAPTRAWLEALSPGGRLVVPLTVDAPGLAAGGAGIGVGWTWKLVREGIRWPVSVISQVGIYHCVGARDPESEARLRRAYGVGGHDRVRHLRRDPHPEHPTCWLHTPTLCLARPN